VWIGVGEALFFFSFFFAKRLTRISTTTNKQTNHLPFPSAKDFSVRTLFVDPESLLEQFMFHDNKRQKEAELLGWWISLFWLVNSYRNQLKKNKELHLLQSIIFRFQKNGKSPNHDSPIPKISGIEEFSNFAELIVFSTF